MTRSQLLTLAIEALEGNCSIADVVALTGLSFQTIDNLDIALCGEAYGTDICRFGFACDRILPEPKP